MGGRAQQLYFDTVSPATRLLEKRRKMYEVQDALERQKAQFAEDEEQIRRKEELLRAKDLQLQHHLVKFNKFLQDSEAKRRRAETRAQEEEAQNRQKDAEISELETQLERSRQRCADMEDLVSRNMLYEEFLESVKDTCEEYNEIQDLITRYDTLDAANKDLKEVHARTENECDELRDRFAAYRRQQEEEMLNRNNHISELALELEEVLKVRQELEKTVEEASQEDSRQSLYFGQVLVSVDNLYNRCTNKRRGIQHFLEMNVEEGQAEDDDREGSFKGKKDIAVKQLNVLLNYIKDFDTITGKVSSHVERERRERRFAQPPVEEQKSPDIQFIPADQLGGSPASRSPAAGSSGHARGAMLS